MSLRTYLVLLSVFALERGLELALSTRNARRALSRGAVEAGRGHYPAMVLFHALFLVACAAEALVFPAAPPAWAWLAVLLALAGQALRWWSVAALGERWNTRILVLPASSPVKRGPYRWLRHPNYVAVVVEIAALPLAFGSWRTALAFSLGNAALLAVRIPAEERALGAAWQAAFAETPRFVPGAAVTRSPVASAAPGREGGGA